MVPLRHRKLVELLELLVEVLEMLILELSSIWVVVVELSVMVVMVGVEVLEEHLPVRLEELVGEEEEELVEVGVLLLHLVELADLEGLVLIQMERQDPVVLLEQEVVLRGVREEALF